MPSINQYYRPYLTGENIDALIKLLAEQLPEEYARNYHLLDAYKKLNTLKLKKDMGMAFVAHVTKGSVKEQFVNSLDLDGQSKNKPAPLTAEQLMENAWKKFQSNPANCSEDEIELAQNYRYSNGLMSSEEMNEYDSARGLNF